MANRRGDLSHIEARLGRTLASRDTPGGARETRAKSEPQQEPSGGNGLFLSLLGLVFAIGAGAFLASGAGAGVRQAILADLTDKPAEVYLSRVAKTCDHGWKDDRINRDQIHCYMTEQVSRLCDPRERRALIDKLLAYQAAEDRVDGRLLGASVGIIVNPNVMAMGLAEAKSHDPNLTPDQRAAQFNNVMGMASDVMSPADKVIADNVNEISSATAVDDVKTLAERGYLKSEDFPDAMPKIVKKGLAAATHVSPSLCIKG